MIKHGLILACIFVVSGMEAQYFGKKNLSLQQGFINFHAKSLNNSINSNTRISRVNEIEKSLHLSQISSLNLGLGLGNIRNLSDQFLPFENSNFMRCKLGLAFHFPSNYSSSNWSPRLINPYAKVAYNLDIMNQTFADKYASRLSSSLKLGLGLVFKITHEIGVLYEFSHNQYISEDYRSFYQQNIGLVINMDERYKSY